MSDVFSKAAGGFLSVCSIFVLFAGLNKLGKLLNIYRERHINAVYGFYSNLYTECVGLVITLRTNEEYWKKSEEKKSEKSDADVTYEIELKTIAKSFLSLFKSEKNQVPPDNNYDEWEKQIGYLQKSLYILQYIGEIDYVNNYAEYMTKLTTTLKYFIGDDETQEIGAIKNEKLNISKKLFPPKRWFFV